MSSQVAMKVSRVVIVVGAHRSVIAICVPALSYHTDFLFCIQAPHRSMITFLAKPWLPNVLVNFHGGMDS